MKKLVSLAAFLLVVFSYGIAQPPLVSIHDLQYISPQNLAVGNDVSAYEGDTVQVEGVVTFDPCAYALSSTNSRIGTWLNNPAGGPWSGIHVLIDPVAVGYSGSLTDLDNATRFLDNFQVGNVVRCTGVVSTFAGNTQILLIPVQSQVMGISALPAPVVLPVDSFMVSDGAGGQLINQEKGEQFEGVLVELQNVFVVDVSQGTQGNTGRIYWSLQQGANRIQIRDVSGHISNRDSDINCNPNPYTPTSFPLPVEGSFYSYIRGIIVEYASQGEQVFSIAPRDLSDLGPITASPPVVSNVKKDLTKPSSLQSVTISADIVDNDGSILGARLYFAIGLTNQIFQYVNMTNVGGDRYAGTIPATNTDMVFVKYYIRAEDDDNLLTYYPDSNATGSFYYVLNSPISQIEQIQWTPFSNGASIWAGDTLTNMVIEAIVTSTQADYDLGFFTTVQDGTGPWSGIFMFSPNPEILNLQRGDRILITEAYVQERFQVTQLTNPVYTIVSRNNPLPGFATTLHPDSVNNKVMGQTEPYEGMLVRFDNVYITNENPDGPMSNFGEWQFNTVQGATTGLRADDTSPNIPFGFNTDSLSLGQNLPFIQGVLYYSFGNWKLLPRNQSDIGGFNTRYPKAINSFVFNGLNPPLAATVNQNQNTITLEVPFGTDVSALVPTIDFSGLYLDPASGVANDFTTPVTYTAYAPVDSSARPYLVTISIASGLEELLAGQPFEVFPNPAERFLNIRGKNGAEGNYLVQVLELTGKAVLSQSGVFLSEGRFHSFDVSGLTPGTYFLEVSDGIANRYIRKISVAR